MQSAIFIKNIFRKAIFFSLLLCTHAALAGGGGALYLYSSSAVTQQTGTSYPSDVNQPVLRVSITSVSGGGSNPLILSQARFTMQNTSNADVAAARLYYTGSSATFTTGTLLGTIASPSGTITFAPAHTLGFAGTHYYWLAFDVAGSPGDGNYLDAYVPSGGLVFTENGSTGGGAGSGGPYTPSTANPAGQRVINVPFNPPAPPTPGGLAFQKTYGSSANNESAFAMCTTSDGGYAAAGSQTIGAGWPDFCLVRTDGNGVMLWNRLYGGTGQDIARQVQQTSDGGYVMTGNTWSFGNGWEDVYVVKTNSLGAVQWSAGYGSTASDTGNDIRQTSDGGYIVTGYAGTGAGATDLYLLKINNTGTLTWSMVLGGASLDVGQSVRQTAGGGYIVTGRTGSFGPSPSENILLLRVSPTGGFQWMKVFGTTDGALLDRGYSVHEMGNGDFTVAGMSRNQIATGWNSACLLRMNASGGLLWSRVYGFSTDNTYAECHIPASDGGFVISGRVGDATGWDFDDTYLIKTDGTGNLQWTKIYGGNQGDTGYMLAQAADGGFMIAGSTSSLAPGTPNSSFYLLKTDALGRSGCNEAVPGTVQANYGAITEAGASPSITTANGSGYVSTSETVPSLTETSLCITALPVGLLDFSGMMENGTVRLLWHTSSESGSDYFEIQRSTDGKTFSPIGIVQAKGNSFSLAKYKFTDHLTDAYLLPASPAGGSPVSYFYYRLRQVDYDGAWTYSEVIAVHAAGVTPHFSVRHEQGFLEVALSLPETAEMTLGIYNCLGQSVQEILLGVLPPGGHRFRIPSGLPKGMYYAVTGAGTAGRLVIY